MYEGKATNGRPAVLGYFVGYRIAEAYYKEASDKKKAIAALLSEEADSTTAATQGDLRILRPLSQNPKTGASSRSGTSKRTDLSASIRFAMPSRSIEQPFRLVG